MHKVLEIILIKILVYFSSQEGEIEMMLASIKANIKIRICFFNIKSYLSGMAFPIVRGTTRLSLGYNVKHVRSL